jgi:hypothetical protein
MIISKGVALIKAWRAGTLLATAAQLGLNTALIANPIGLVVAGIAALGAAFFIAYKKSDTFRRGVQIAMGKAKLVIYGFAEKATWLLSKIPGPWQGAMRAANREIRADIRRTKGSLESLTTTTAQREARILATEYDKLARKAGAINVTPQNLSGLPGALSGSPSPNGPVKPKPAKPSGGLSPLPGALAGPRAKLGAGITRAVAAGRGDGGGAGVVEVLDFKMRDEVVARATVRVGTKRAARA